MTANNIDVTVTVSIARERLGDLICCALEGGSTFWCENFAQDEYPEGCKWGHEAVAAGAGFTIEHGDEGPLHVDNSDEVLKKALTTLATEYRSHWMDFINDSEDADTGDAFFQVLCFGEIVYG